MSNPTDSTSIFAALGLAEDASAEEIGRFIGVYEDDFSLLVRCHACPIEADERCCGEGCHNSLRTALLTAYAERERQAERRRVWEALFPWCGECDCVLRTSISPESSGICGGTMAACPLLTGQKGAEDE